MCGSAMPLSITCCVWWRPRALSRSSPRGSLALLAATRAWAFLDGRDYVIPEDVQAVLPTVVGHRLRERADATGHGGGALVHWLLREVPAL